MKLTQYSNFTLRTLQFAALRDPDLVTVDDVARAHGISKSHLVKVAYELSQRGYIETVRGRNGGMRLARSASDISVGEIIRWTEAPLELVECFNIETNTCPLEGLCRLSLGLKRALSAFLAVVDDLTIADISSNRRALNDRLLSVSKPTDLDEDGGTSQIKP